MSPEHSEPRLKGLVGVSEGGKFATLVIDFALAGADFDFGDGEDRNSYRKTAVAAVAVAAVEAGVAAAVDDVAVVVVVAAAVYCFDN
jgi:hypothetical protein